MSKLAARQRGKCDHCGKMTIRDDFVDGSVTLRHEMPECETFTALMASLAQVVIRQTVTVDLIPTPDEPS